MTPILQKFSYPVRLFLLLGLLVFNYVIFFPGIALLVTAPFASMQVITEAISGDIKTDLHKYVFLVFQGIVSFGSFAATAVVFSYWESRSAIKHLRLNYSVPLKFIVLAILAVLVSQVFIEFLVTINRSIPLPDLFSSLIETEKKHEALTNALLSGSSTIQFIVNVIVIALVPAIAEEFFFRGVLLGDMLKERMNPVFSILASGFIFAIGHMNYSQVLAIWALGCFLGYLYYVSGSLWLPIAAHFTNNFLAVLFKYLYNTGAIGRDLAEAETPFYASLISMAVFIGFVFIFNKWKKPATFVEPVQPIETNNTY